MKFTPMLAVLTDAPFDDKEWLFEWKWDGYRSIAAKNQTVHLYSRNMQLFDERFAQIIAELKKLPGKFVIDGELVIFNAKGKSDFQMMQQFQKNRKGTPYFFVFDILTLNGKDLTKLPLIERKKILAKLMKRSLKHVKFNTFVIGKGIVQFKRAIDKGFEGIIAKKIDSPYRFKRSSEWLKVKAKQRQEFVIGGFTAPKLSRKHFGSILIGIYEKGKLIYAGHVGGGFNQKLLADTYTKMKKLQTKACPFAKTPKTNTPATWIKPKLVCEVEFQEWTQEGILRIPIFKGLRLDKGPREIKREYVKIHKS